jgi:hypothetical protein
VGVTRRIIFPIVRIILWAIIAAALVKIAFAGTTSASGDDPLTPSGQIVEEQVEVATATITNTVTVQGSVLADPAVPVKATMAGKVTSLLVERGTHVDVGAPLLRITLETPVEPTTTTNPETGEQTVREHSPQIKRQTVTATTAGTITLSALKDQELSVGDEIGSISPGSLSVTGALTADQQYRLLTSPKTAEVTLKGGPKPFTCTGLRIGAAPAGDAGAGAGGSAPEEVNPATGAPVEQASGSLTCAIPAGITSFAGLGADVAITNGSAKDAMVVPVTAVQGSIQSGNVWVVKADGTNEPREVALGLTDGEVVQITKGLAKGDQVLKFIPVGDVVNPEQTGQDGYSMMGG